MPRHTKHTFGQYAPAHQSRATIAPHAVSIAGAAAAAAASSSRSTAPSAAVAAPPALTAPAYATGGVCATRRTDAMCHGGSGGSDRFGGARSMNPYLARACDGDAASSLSRDRIRMCHHAIPRDR